MGGACLDLPADCCLFERRYADKRACLGDLAGRAAERLGLDRGAVLAALLHRESLGSTGVGDGVALPHARQSTLDKPLVLLARLATPLAFEAVDGRPVDLVCLLLLPDQPGASPDPSLLARCARMLRDRATVAAMRSADGPAALSAAIRGPQRDR